MNFVIASIVVILIMLCAVSGFMLALIKKLEILEDSLDVIKFGVKDVISEDNRIIHDDISNLSGILDKLLEIEKDFDSNMAKSTNELVDVCKNHLCAIMDRCQATEQAVKSMRESTDTLEDQVTAITDYIRDQTVKKEPAPYQESSCDLCKYNDGCVFCRSDVMDVDPQTCCYYEPKNAFEQAGDV